jgi:type II secretory pathway component PulK
VSSAYFLVRIEAQIGQAHVRAQSLLFRGDKGDLHVIQRSQARNP